MVTQNPTHFLGCHLATSNSVGQHKLRKRIAYLAGVEGKGLVSLYIPAGSPIEQTLAALKQELPDCNHTELRLECEEQEDAVSQMLQYVRQKRTVPQNGLALFAGYTNPQRKVVFVEEIVPPQPVASYLLEVSSRFQLSPLREMLRDRKIVGLIALDAKDAAFGLLEGEQLQYLSSLSSGVPGKSHKGGQSQRRYERERDMELAAFFHRIAEHATEQFLRSRRITALLVGGPGPTKADFLKGEYLNYGLENVLLDMVDAPSAGRESLAEILHRSDGALKNMCAPDEKKIVMRLMAELNKPDGGLVTYGLDAVLESLKRGEVEVALVTDDTGIMEVVASCKKCGATKAKITGGNTLEVQKDLASSPCANCSEIHYDFQEKDIVDVLEDAAAQTSARVDVISSESPQKSSLRALGGVAAILRYRR